MKWQRETRTGNLASRSILLASEEIERISDEIKITDSIKDSALEIFSSSSKSGLVRGRSSDNTLIRKLLNWEPKYNLLEGLKKTYHWIEEDIKAIKIK